MKTKKINRGGGLLLALILAVNMLMPASVWAAVGPDQTVTRNITIDGASVTLTYLEATDKPWTYSGQFTEDDEFYVLYRGCHITLDGSTLIQSTDDIVDGGAYTTVPIPLDFTAPESLSMRATQGSSALTIEPCVINNTGSEDLKLSQVEITAATGWAVVNSSTDFTTADSKNKIAFKTGTHDFSSGSYAPVETITAGGNATVQLEGKISEKADLTSATQVASIVLTVEKAGPTLISFTIHHAEGTETETYQAESGMSWGEWCDSKYNTSKLYIDGDSHVSDSSSGVGAPMASDEYSFCKILSSEIISDSAYYISNGKYLFERIALSSVFPEVVNCSLEGEYAMLHPEELGEISLEAEETYLSSLEALELDIPRDVTDNMELKYMFYFYIGDGLTGDFTFNVGTYTDVIIYQFIDGVWRETIINWDDPDAGEVSATSVEDGPIAIFVN